MKIDRTFEVLERFNRLADVWIDKLSHEDREFMEHWKVYIAIALIDDFGKDLFEEICSIADTIMCNNG